MDRAMWKQHLALAERQVLECTRRVARQRQIVAELEGDDDDATRAQALLAQLELVLKFQLQERDRLQADLAQGGTPLPA